MVSVVFQGISSGFILLNLDRGSQTKGIGLKPLDLYLLSID